MSNKSRTVLSLLSFFLGVFGAHRFYAGLYGSGTAMLIVSLTGLGLIVTGIWNLIDFIVCISGQFRDVENKLIKNW